MGGGDGFVIKYILVQAFLKIYLGLAGGLQGSMVWYGMVWYGVVWYGL